MFYSLENPYFYKKVVNGDLGSFAVLDGIAEDRINFLAGEISVSFEKVLKFCLKSDLAVCVLFILLSPISLVSSIFKEFSHNSCFFLFFGNLNLDVPGGGRHPGTKQILRLSPKWKNIINEDQKYYLIHNNVMCCRLLYLTTYLVRSRVLALYDKNSGTYPPPTVRPSNTPKIII